MSTNLRNPADRRDYPARWTMRRGKELFREIDERSADGSEELLSVSHITGITPRSQKNVTMFQSESLVGYKICRPGDIAANTMWTWQGAIGVSDYFGVISPSYNVYRQRQDTYNPRFLDFLLREPKLVDVYYSLSTGIRPSRRRLYPDEFLTIRFPVPPRAEQDKIVRLLDEKANAIDEVIATRQKQIDELDELRKAVIDCAVTKGIKDRLCTMRYSGIPWLDKVPLAWDVVRVSRVASESRVKNIGNIEHNVLSLSYGKIIPKQNTNSALTPTDYATWQIVEKGCVVLRLTDLQNDQKSLRCGLVQERGIVTSAYVSLVPENVLPEWLYLIMNVYDLRKVFYSMGGGLRQGMNYGDVAKLLIPLPPIDEQREIAAYLDEKCAAIDKAIGNRKAAIEELVALKARIVADAVTGRMEVK